MRGFDKLPKIGGEELQLPSINDKKTPFKGFLDISIVTQKLRKSVGPDGRNAHTTIGESSRHKEDGPIEGN